MMQQVMSLEEVQAVVRSTDRVRVVGGGSKPALSRGATIDLSKLTGILQYEPSEFTFTALAGTPLAEIDAALAEHGQFLPFDPPLVAAGATLGGTIAAGLSGPGRFRYGGVRDFLLGVRMVTGGGEIVFGGGKVVKNAAGFDIPKLLVGSLGSFGVMVEVTMKVFPRPQRCATLRVAAPDLEAATATMTALASAPLDLSCVDLQPPGTLWLRLAGLSDALAARVARVRQFVPWPVAELLGDEDTKAWRDASAFAWLPADHSLIKLPIAPPQIAACEKQFASESALAVAPRRYSVGGNVLWLAWPDAVPQQRLTAICRTLGRPALALSGGWNPPLIHAPHHNTFYQRLREVFDPAGKCGNA